MECKKFELTASAYVDRQLHENEAVEYREHLATCEGCRLHFTEIEQVSLALRNIERPETPRELRGYIMNEAARRARREITLTESVLAWIQKLNPRLVAYATGVVISFLSFASLFSSFRPIPLSSQYSEQAAIVPIISGSDREFHSYNNLPPDQLVNDVEH